MNDWLTHSPPTLINFLHWVWAIDPAWIYSPHHFIMFLIRVSNSLVCIILAFTLVFNFEGFVIIVLFYCPYHVIVNHMDSTMMTNPPKFLLDCLLWTFLPFFHCLLRDLSGYLLPFFSLFAAWLEWLSVYFQFFDISSFLATWLEWLTSRQGLGHRPKPIHQSLQKILCFRK